MVVAMAGRVLRAGADDYEDTHPIGLLGRDATYAYAGAVGS